MYHCCTWHYQYQICLRIWKQFFRGVPGLSDWVIIGITSYPDLLGCFWPTWGNILPNNVGFTWCVLTGSVCFSDLTNRLWFSPEEKCFLYHRTGHYLFNFIQNIFQHTHDMNMFHSVCLYIKERLFLLYCRELLIMTWQRTVFLHYWDFFLLFILTLLFFLNTPVDFVTCEVKSCD